MYNEQRAALQGVTPQSLPEWAGKLAELGRKMRVEGKAWLTNDEAAELAANALNCALAVTLHQRGAVVHALPGAAVRMQIGATVIEPYQYGAATRCHRIECYRLAYTMCCGGY